MKLGFCGAVTDTVLGALGASCKKLRDLDLYWWVVTVLRGINELRGYCTVDRV